MARECLTRVLFFSLILLLGGAGESSALGRESFDRIVDFSVTIKTLSQMPPAQEADFLKSGKLFLLNGTVTGILFVNPDEEGFSVRVELVSGEWLGLEEVKSYRCTVSFKGKEYFGFFPRRLPQNPTADMIAVNDRILVVARALQRASGEKGEPAWLLEGFHIRRLR